MQCVWESNKKTSDEMKLNEKCVVFKARYYNVVFVIGTVKNKNKTFLARLREKGGIKPK